MLSVRIPKMWNVFSNCSPNMQNLYIHASILMYSFLQVGYFIQVDRVWRCWPQRYDSRLPELAEKRSSFQLLLSKCQVRGISILLFPHYVLLLLKSQPEKKTYYYFFPFQKRTATNNWKMLPTDMLSAIKKKVNTL